MAPVSTETVVDAAVPMSTFVAAVPAAEAAPAPEPTRMAASTSVAPPAETVAKAAATAPAEATPTEPVKVEPTQGFIQRRVPPGTSSDSRVVVTVCSLCSCTQGRVIMGLGRAAEGEDLHTSVLKQVELYFARENLANDPFLGRVASCRHVRRCRQARDLTYLLYGLVPMARQCPGWMPTWPCRSTW